MGATALVWFKRDLRVSDHAPLAEARRFERAMALYVVEPAWLARPDFDPRQLRFALEAVACLREDLAARGLPLLVRVGDVPQVLHALHQATGFSHLLSHEETGAGWTWTRDRAVAGWCRERGVAWTEFPQTGVVRRLRSRAGWAAAWLRRMEAPQAQRVDGFAGIAGLAGEPLPTLRGLGLAEPAVPPVPAGERAAWTTLEGFLAGRGRDYRRSLSSPLTAPGACSRLSEHLAFGTISMRSVHQATEAAIRSSADRELAQSLRAFSGRLRWHCHFMQKLEDEPQLEFRNLARACDGLRDAAPDHERLQAWCEGRTGYPMVDACMRQLRATGWLNFRMRAMLVSFAAYHLWLHWREPGLFLARQFLDYEPGIHWCQMQMQSGTTGINTLRIYSPAKQARDHDPAGAHVRRWVPEIGSPAYPPPIVNERLAVAAAKAAHYGLRGTASARAEADAIQERHGSRRSGLKPVKRRLRGMPPATPQGELF